MGIQRENAHCNREEDRRPEALQEEVCQSLENGIRNKENTQDETILFCRHVYGLRQTSNLSVANVGAVEETDEVE